MADRQTLKKEILKYFFYKIKARNIQEIFKQQKVIRSKKVAKSFPSSECFVYKLENNFSLRSLTCRTVVKTFCSFLCKNEQ